MNTKKQQFCPATQLPPGEVGGIESKNAVQEWAPTGDPKKITTHLIKDYKPLCQGPSDQSKTNPHLIKLKAMSNRCILEA